MHLIKYARDFNSILVRNFSGGFQNFCFVFVFWCWLLHSRHACTLGSFSVTWKYYCYLLLFVTLFIISAGIATIMLEKPEGKQNQHQTKPEFWFSRYGTQLSWNYMLSSCRNALSILERIDLTLQVVDNSCCWSHWKQQQQQKVFLRGREKNERN